MRHGKKCPSRCPSRCPARLLLTAGPSHPRPTSYSRHLVTRGRKGSGVSQPNLWREMGPWTSFFTPGASRASFLGRVSRPVRNYGRFQRSHTQAKTWSARVFEFGMAWTQQHECHHLSETTALAAGCCWSSPCPHGLPGPRGISSCSTTRLEPTLARAGRADHVVARHDANGRPVSTPSSKLLL